MAFVQNWHVFVLKIVAYLSTIISVSLRAYSGLQIDVKSAKFVAAGFYSGVSAKNDFIGG